MNFIREKNGTLINIDNNEYENARKRKSQNKKHLIIEKENEIVKQRILELEKRVAQLEKKLNTILEH